MTYKVGIPQALLYYQYYPMWNAFFNNIGTDIVVSEATNQRTVARGAARMVSDTCLPMKVFTGHVLSLVGKCDYIFIPVLRSTAPKVFNCSRFLGLSDVTRAVVPEAPPVIEIEFDVNRGRSFLYRQIYNVGSLFTRNPFKIKAAALQAWNTHKQYQALIRDKRLARVEAIEIMQRPTVDEGPKHVIDDIQTITIGLVGHPYVLYDEQVSHRLIKRLRSCNVSVLTPGMFSTKDSGGTELTNEYWESEAEVIGAGEEYIRQKVDGIIGVMAFSCGPDSLMMHLVQRQAQRTGIPFMCLTVEEHTAEAGVITRLEAFLDMIYHRRRKTG